MILRVTDPKVYDQFEAHIEQLRIGTTIVPEAGSGARVSPKADLTQDLSNLESPKAYAD